jgi:hypothetical protein
LSLSGKFARFGRQAAQALDVWQRLDGAIELTVQDDDSHPRTLQRELPHLASRVDVLLGPYSTRLVRAAGDLASESGWLLWNHGGSGDDVEGAHPGHVVSVLTPTSRYAIPFVRHLVDHNSTTTRLWIAEGRGSFGRQVAGGTETAARRAGIVTTRLGPGDDLPCSAEPWNLFTAGQFEEDVELVRRARALSNPPTTVCAVAAGVHEFVEAAGDVEGTFGVGQWFPGHPTDAAAIGPSEAIFLAAYGATTPDYPAIQAVAGAVIATHCARQVGTAGPALWRAARELDCSTLFGRFKIRDDGTQVGHLGALVRWTKEGPVAMPQKDQPRDL